MHEIFIQYHWFIREDINTPEHSNSRYYNIFRQFFCFDKSVLLYSAWSENYIKVSELIQQQTFNNVHPQQQYQSPPPSQQSQYQQPQYQKPQYQQQQNQYQQPEYEQPQNQYQASQPQHCEGRRQQTTGLSKLIPFGPGVTASSAPPRQGPASPGVAQPYRQQNTRWAPVPAALSPQVSVPMLTSLPFRV